MAALSSPTQGPAGCVVLHAAATLILSTPVQGFDAEGGQGAAGHVELARHCCQAGSSRGSSGPTVQ